MTLQALKAYWDKYCEVLEVDHNTVTEFWGKIETLYSKKHRFYHNLSHIHDMLQHLESVEDKLKEPALVAMAIFFHDLVYDAKNRDNEEKSVELYRKFHERIMKPGIDAAKVDEWILSTKKHETEIHRKPGEFGTDDVHYFLDFDMAILGSDPEVYNKYAANIRKEYSHIPEKHFRKGRSMFLESVLESEKEKKIYATEIFYNKFEAQARENMQAEIKRHREG